MKSEGALEIRPAGPADLPLLLGFIRELAEYEKALERVHATETLLHESLFGSPRRAEALLGFLSGKPVAFAVYYHSFSTYLGSHCLHLEDLFVREESRGAGWGRAMLAEVSRVARERGCAALEWSSLAWNEQAKGFYLRLGATAQDRVMYRLTGVSLASLAAERDRSA
jgi:GNAT superfamily N-acetyltransferase